MLNVRIIAVAVVLVALGAVAVCTRNAIGTGPWRDTTGVYAKRAQ